MLKNLNPRYVRTVIDGDLILKDLGNRFRFVSQRPYTGKPESGLASGANVTLQAMEDNAPTVVDKKSGLPKDNNVFETFDVTIVGVTYPLAFKKGDFVELGGFMPEASYFIDFNLILRFNEVKAINKPPLQGGNANVAARKEQ